MTTVSKAILGVNGVHPKTRAQILDCAGRLGYVRGARRSRKAEPRLIMVLAQCVTSISDQRYLVGMSAAAVKLDIAVFSITWI